MSKTHWIYCYLVFFLLISLRTMSTFSSSTSTAIPRIAILGGGIHGVSTAYYLSTKFGVASTIIEQTAIASAASGKAGGFLARGWGNGPTVALHEKSYDLHKELASSLNIQSYREIPTLSVNGNRKGANIPSWLDRKVSSSMMDTNTAQVTPAEFTEKLLKASEEAGTRVIIDSAVGIDLSEDGKVKGVLLKNGGKVEADKVIICMGPWSGVAIEDWFAIPLPMEGIKSTSLVYKNLAPIQSEPFACFCEEDANDCHLELYPRNNGDLYICGCGGSDYVRGDRLRGEGDCGRSELIQADPNRVQAASSSLKSMSSLGDATPDVAQACMRPCTSDAMPVMSSIPGFEGAYVSAGHNCWGILWAPISGLCMAELVMTGESSTIDLRPFTLSRFMKKSSSTRGRKMINTNVGEQW